MGAHGDRLLARCPCPCHGSSEWEHEAWRRIWEMALLVSPHVSVLCGNCVRKWGAAAGFWGGEPLQTVSRAKTDFGLMEGKGKCGAAFATAANLAVGSLYIYIF